MNNYWKRRDLIERLRLFDLTEEDLKKILQKEYLRVYKEVRQLLLELINSLPANPTADMIYREDKFYKLLNEIQFKLDHLGEFEKDNMQNTFKNFFVENANSMEGNFNIAIDDERVFNAINSVWCGDGKNFSDRIWSDKRKLLESLKTGLINTITTGSNWGTFSKQLANDFGVSFNNSRRLVRTELSHIQNESTIYKYKTEGVEQVRYIAENDCCDDCMKNNGKVFPIDKAPIIPMHPNCRCTYIPIITPKGE